MRGSRNRTYRRIAWWSPLASLVLLALLYFSLPNRAEFDSEAAARRVRIQQVITSAPYLIGSWIGQDAPVPQEAQELLRPNAILSRSYAVPGGWNVHVLVVHCSDARDMIGHYPPICYPSSGYVSEPGSGSETREIEVDGLGMLFRVYRFRRMRERASEESIRIFSGFALPNGTFTPDIDDINRQSERLSVTVQGVAQLQVVTPGAMPLEEAASAAHELLAGMGDLLRELRAPGASE